MIESLAFWQLMLASTVGAICVLAGVFAVAVTFVPRYAEPFPRIRPSPVKIPSPAEANSIDSDYVPPSKRPMSELIAEAEAARNNKPKGPENVTVGAGYPI